MAPVIIDLLIVRAFCLHNFRMARSKSIREDVQFYIDILFDLYDQTDPDLGEESAYNKTEVANYAIEVWWRLHGKLMAWTQNHTVGHAIMTENPEFSNWFQKTLGRDVDEDGHELEYIGWQYNWLNMPEANNDIHKEVSGLLEYIIDERLPQPTSEPLNDKAIRRLIYELLMSRSADNSFWRFELQNSLLALNYGEVRPLVRPDPQKKQGRAFSLRMAKASAVEAVYFLTGKGLKKYIALEEVGNGIGQSPETLRSWEKQLMLDRDFNFRFSCAELAGVYCEELMSKDWSKIPEEEEFRKMRGMNMLDFSSNIVENLNNKNYSKIKEEIRRCREKI